LPKANFQLPKLKTTFIAGIEFDVITKKAALNRVANFFQGKISSTAKIRKIWGRNNPKQKFLLVTPNPEIVLAANQDQKLRKILNSADLSVSDGIGILWASYFLSLKKRNFLTLLLSLLAIFFAPKKIRQILPERLTGTDLFPKILKLVAQQKEKIFLLGGEKGIAEKLKKKLETKIPDLIIAGTFAGTPKKSAEEKICAKINASKATILFVAFGAPAQEFWLAHNLVKLKTVKFSAGIGGAYDFYAGKILRAPKFLRKLGLEWFWRLLRQPQRLPRIWNATFRFIYLIWQQRK
jgi:N-acetylglucosaminyldiphosphoundecaprenol N-acetyl-beta-D-mannosaminyltransferase